MLLMLWPVACVWRGVARREVYHTREEKRGVGGGWLLYLLTVCNGLACLLTYYLRLKGNADSLSIDTISAAVLSVY
eukprot:COSAG06_NODE_3613_length_5120_cov_36.976897_2_plen_76_part_00